jgi:hypothetical protein
MASNTMEAGKRHGIFDKRAFRLDSLWKPCSPVWAALLLARPAASQIGIQKTYALVSFVLR